MEDRLPVPGSLSAPGRVLGQKHLPELDGVRGIAILLVTIVHFASLEVDPNLESGGRIARIWATLATHGTSGVGLFFVLSGFLITRILIRSRKQPRYFSNFYIRRTLRIFPLYYASIALVLFVLVPFVFPTDPGHDRLAAKQAWLWAYSSNIPPSFGLFRWRAGWLNFIHFWSLAVEEHFYFVWPAVVAWLSDRQLLRLCVVSTAVSFVLKLVFLKVGWTDGAYMFTLCRADALLLGAMLALLGEQLDGPPKLERIGRRFCLVAGSVLLLLGLKYLLGRIWWTTAITHTAYAFFWTGSLALVLVGRSGSFVSRFLGCGVLRFFGRYSYGLYVWHGLAVPAFTRLIPLSRLQDWGGSRLAGLAIFYAICLVTSTAAAFVSWHAFEKHFTQLKGRFT